MTLSLPWTRLPEDEILHVKTTFYDAPWRDYHGWHHPVAMWERAAAWGLEHDEELDRAILWHDAIDRVEVSRLGLNPNLSIEFHSCHAMKLWHAMKPYNTKTHVAVNGSITHILTTECPSFQGDARLNTLDLAGFVHAAEPNGFNRTWADTEAVLQEGRNMRARLQEPDPATHPFTGMSHFLDATAARLKQDLHNNPPHPILQPVQTSIVQGMQAVLDRVRQTLTTKQG